MDPYLNPGISRYLRHTVHTNSSQGSKEQQQNQQNQQQLSGHSSQGDKGVKNEASSSQLPEDTTSSISSSSTKSSSSSTPTPTNHSGRIFPDKFDKSAQSSLSKCNDNNSVCDDIHCNQKNCNTPKMTIPTFNRTSTSSSFASVSTESLGDTEGANENENSNDNKNKSEYEQLKNSVPAPAASLTCDDFFATSTPAPIENTVQSTKEESKDSTSNINTSNISNTSSSTSTHPQPRSPEPSLKPGHVSQVAMARNRSYKSLQNNTDLEVFQNDDSLCPSSSEASLSRYQKNSRNSSMVGFNQYPVSDININDTNSDSNNNNNNNSQTNFRFPASFDLFANDHSDTSSKLNSRLTSSSSLYSSSATVPMSLLHTSKALPTTKLTPGDSTEIYFNKKDVAGGGDAFSSLQDLNNPSSQAPLHNQHHHQSFDTNDDSAAGVETKSNSAGLFDSKSGAVPFESQLTDYGRFEYDDDVNEFNRGNQFNDTTGSTKNSHLSDRGEYLPGTSSHLQLNPAPAFEVEDYLAFTSQLSEDQVKGLPFSIRRKIKAMMAGTASDADIESVAQNLDPLLFFSGWPNVKKDQGRQPSFSSIGEDITALPKYTHNYDDDDGLSNSFQSKGRYNPGSSNTATPVPRNPDNNSVLEQPSRGASSTPIVQDQSSDASNVPTPTPNAQSAASVNAADFMKRKNTNDTAKNSKSKPITSSPFHRVRSQSQSNWQNHSSNLSNAIASNSNSASQSSLTNILATSSTYTPSPLAGAATFPSKLDRVNPYVSLKSPPVNQNSFMSMERAPIKTNTTDSEYSPLSPITSRYQTSNSDTIPEEYYAGRPVSEGEPFRRDTSRKNSSLLSPLRTDMPSPKNSFIASGNFGTSSSSLRRARSSVNRCSSASSSYTAFNGLVNPLDSPKGFRGPIDAERNEQRSFSSRFKFPSRRNSMFTVGSNNDLANNGGGLSSAFGAANASPALQFLTKIGSATSSPMASRRGSVAGGIGGYSSSVANTGNISSASSRYTEGMSSSVVQGDEDLGAEIGNYVIGARLGHGGFSVVREASTLDEETGKQVVRAVKIMEAKGSALDIPKEKLEEFEREVDKEVRQYKKLLMEEEKEGSSASTTSSTTTHGFPIGSGLPGSGQDASSTKAITIVPHKNSPIVSAESDNFPSDLPMSPLSPAFFSRPSFNTLPSPSASTASASAANTSRSTKSTKDKLREFKLRLQNHKIKDYVHELSERMQAEIDHEVILWRELEHPNILTLRDVITKSTNNGVLSRGDSNLSGKDTSSNSLNDMNLIGDDINMKWDADDMVSPHQSSLQSPFSPVRPGSSSTAAFSKVSRLLSGTDARTDSSSSDFKTNNSASNTNDISTLNVGTRTYCFSDKISGGTLYDLVKRRHKIGLNLMLIFGYSKQLASAILYLHDIKKIVHRDIKLENCLIEEQDAEAIGGSSGESVKPWKKLKADRLVLCDFGMSEYFSDEEGEKDKTGDDDGDGNKESEVVFDAEGDLEMKDNEVSRKPKVSSKKILGPARTSSIMEQYHGQNQFQRKKEKQEMQSSSAANPGSSSNLGSSGNPSNPAISSGNTNMCSHPNSRSGSIGGPSTSTSYSTMPPTSTTVDHFGSIPYASPEVLLSRVPIYHPSVDIWAFGVVVYALIMGELPWSHPVTPMLREMIIEGKWNKEEVKKKLDAKLKEMETELLNSNNNNNNNSNRGNRNSSRGSGSNSDSDGDESMESDNEISETSVERLLELLDRIFEKDVSKRVTMREIVDERYFG